jgi:hypothetical protein
MSPGELVRSWWESPDGEALLAACEPGVEWDLRRFAGRDREPVQRGRPEQARTWIELRQAPAEAQ